MKETQEDFFDVKSGISIEEQKEILSKINGITDKKLLSLSQNIVDVKPGVNPVVNAKKSGALFPLIVNLAALAILVGGGFLLVSFNGKKDAQVRTGNAVYDITERALIEEIRKDTSQKLASKENEIASINSRLEDVDAELAKLYSSNQELTAEQRAAQERLLAMQNTYRTDLSALQEERSKILEDSRSKEAKLKAQLEERSREFAAAQQKTSSELDAASAELDRLTTEQQKMAVVDAQLSGALASVSGYVRNSQFDQAEQAVETLKLFLNNNSLSSLRAFQSRKEFYNQSVNFMETMIADARKNSGADAEKESFNLQVKNADLQKKIEDLQKTIDAINSGSSGQEIRLIELEAAITELETEKATLTQTNSDLKTVNLEQEQEITVLRSRINNILQAAQE